MLRCVCESLFYDTLDLRCFVVMSPSPIIVYGRRLVKQGKDLASLVLHSLSCVCFFFYLSQTRLMFFGPRL